MNTSYVLITPARNEEDYIEKSLKSVVSQTILPKKWVIVSDGSTDRTDELVKEYAKEYHFIQLVRLESGNTRNFASKVHAFNAGYQQMKNIEYEFIGNLDADVSLEPDYYQNLFAMFKGNSKLGLAGGVGFDAYHQKIKKVLSASWHVPGNVQMFRKECYEEIGGYLPLEKGEEDSIAEIMARMHGWEVEKFSNLRFLHHRRVGTAKGNIVFCRFDQGVAIYLLGYHPLYMLATCLYRIREKPYLLGSSIRLSGYCFAFLQGKQRIVPKGIINYLRQEQLQRLKGIVFGMKSKNN